MFLVIHIYCSFPLTHTFNCAFYYHAVHSRFKQFVSIDKQKKDNQKTPNTLNAMI